MYNPIEDELVRRTRWLLAHYGEAIVSDVSTGRRAKIYDLVIIEELSNKSRDGKPGFAVFDYGPDDDTDGAVYSDLPRNLKVFTERHQKGMKRIVERLRPLMVLDDLADV